MTDTDAELIASHKGWVEWAKKHWAWEKGDFFFYNIRDSILHEDVFALVTFKKYKWLRGLNWKTETESIYPGKDCIPIPREDQLMDMLEAKIEVKEGYLIKYFDTNDKHWKVSFHYENRGKNKNVLPIIGDFVSAPIRLLALFKAVCKVYGLDK